MASPRKPPIKVGTLYKENDYGLMRKEWRKRFFILETSLLRMFEQEPSEAAAKGAVALPKMVATTENASVSDTRHPRPNKFAFRINLLPAASSNNTSKLILAAETLPDLWEWMRAFQQAGMTITFQGVGLPVDRNAAVTGSMSTPRGTPMAARLPGSARLPACFEAAPASASWSAGANPVKSSTRGKPAGLPAPRSAAAIARAAGSRHRGRRAWHRCDVPH